MQSSKLFYTSGALYALCDESTRQYFYEDGKPKTFEPYLNGHLHGEVILYWPNGNVKRKSHFAHGSREGWDRMWSEEGQLVDEGRYQNKKPLGVHRRWNQKGDLIEEVEYIDWVRFNFRQWDELGELRSEVIWTEEHFIEKTWDCFQKVWIEKQGHWDGKQLVYV